MGLKTETSKQRIREYFRSDFFEEFYFDLLAQFIVSSIENSLLNFSDLTIFHLEFYFVSIFYSFLGTAIGKLVIFFQFA